MSDAPKWWVLEDPVLREMLATVAAGEDPEWVYAQAYLTADHEEVDADAD